MTILILALATLASLVYLTVLFYRLAMQWRGEGSDD